MGTYSLAATEVHGHPFYVKSAGHGKEHILYRSSVGIGQWLITDDKLGIPSNAGTIKSTRGVRLPTDKVKTGILVVSTKRLEWQYSWQEAAGDNCWRDDRTVICTPKAPKVVCIILL